MLPHYMLLLLYMVYTNTKQKHGSVEFEYVVRLKFIYNCDQKSSGQNSLSRYTACTNTWICEIVKSSFSFYRSSGLVNSFCLFILESRIESDQLKPNSEKAEQMKKNWLQRRKTVVCRGEFLEFHNELFRLYILNVLLDFGILTVQPDLFILFIQLVWYLFLWMDRLHLCIHRLQSTYTSYSITNTVSVTLILH